MRFNAVVATNRAAVSLWSALGFKVQATVPEAFDHPRHGPVGLHLMHRRLESPEAASDESPDQTLNVKGARAARRPPHSGASLLAPGRLSDRPPNRYDDSPCARRRRRCAESAPAAEV